LSKGEMAVTPEMAQALLSYDAETGKLYWKPRPVEMFSDGRHTAAHSCAKWNAKHAGKEAFTSASGGRPEGRIFGRGFRAHRVIWAIVTGEWPKEEIDHKDRNPLNNRFDNLRPCTHRQNLMNQSSTAGSTSAFIGVSFSRSRKKWIAQISPSRRRIYLGRFDREEDAAMAYDAAARQHFGEFANLNVPNIARM